MKIEDYDNVNFIIQALYDLDDVYDMFETLEVGVQGLNAANIKYIEDTILNERQTCIKKMGVIFLKIVGGRL